VARESTLTRESTLNPHSVSHGVLNNRPRARILGILVKYHGDTSSVSDLLGCFQLNTILEGIVSIIIKSLSNPVFISNPG
jgi:hypothetical protein